MNQFSSAPHSGGGDAPLEVLIQQLDADLGLPTAAHPGDAGVDLHAATTVRLAPGERAKVATGIAIALPAGWAAFVHPRSGLAARHGITIVNAPGVVDAAYRGEIAVTLLNTDKNESFEVQRGARIAQLIFQRVGAPRFVSVEKLPGSHRGASGFGSSGTAQKPGVPDEGGQL